MKFFVPNASDVEQAKRVYAAIAEFNGAQVGAQRVYALQWEHNGQAMSCAVGESLPPYYQTGAEPVLAILDCGTFYTICTPNRGGIRGDPVMAGKGYGTTATLFSAS
ncbi:MAG: hypothetical protein H0X13_13620 [Ramlibacter sp.]|nr:hypothetical protein [Ramlibacter sp.]